MINALLKLAEHYLKNHNINRALRCYQRILKDNPQETEALHGIAVLLAQRGDNKNALSYVTQAIQQEPTHPIYYNTQGNLHTRLKNFPAAITAYKQAIHLNPNYASAYNNMGNCFYYQHQYQQAKEAYKKAIALSPTASAHYNYGRLWLAEQNYKAAIQAFEATLLCDPSHLMALSQLAHLYMELNNYPLAIVYYQKRLAIQPHHRATQHQCGLAYFKNKSYTHSLALLKKVLTEAPEAPEIHYHLANAFLELGHYQQALAHYLQEIEKHEHGDSYYNIGVILMYQERHQEALSYLKDAIRLAPLHVESYLNVATIYLKLNQHDAAINYYQKALELKPKDPEIEHILSALQDQHPKAIAPVEFVSHLFDQYAPYYDKHLTNYLHYQVPEHLFQSVMSVIHTEHPQWNILDVGCGTGLSGIRFKPLAKKLMGIDISANMIAIAQQTNVYDELHQGALPNQLHLFTDINLVIAADVFPYIGDLSTLFAKIYDLLLDQGLFCFTVEKGNHKEGYHLNPSIRYSHTAAYLKYLAQIYHFYILTFENIVLRQQHHQNIEGYLVILQKTS